MSRCFQCTTKFGFFKHEHDCKNCGKSFCSSCLSFKAAVPAIGNSKQQVCKDCFTRLTRTVSAQENPPSYKEATKSLSPNGVKTADCNLPVGPANIDPDAEIRDRLNNLKANSAVSSGDNTTSAAGTSDEDVADRFKEITGRVPLSMQKSDILIPKPKLTETEEIAQLLEKAQEEAKLDSKTEGKDPDVQGVDDLEKRLLHLKGIDSEKVKPSTYDADSSEDEYDAVKKILKKAMEEDALDERLKASGYGNLIEEDAGEKIEQGMTLPGIPKHPVGSPWKPPPTNVTTSDDEELPWCCICNADARLRCHGCDDDLYCARCFKEGHRGEDMTEHETSPFKKKRIQK